MPESDVKHEIEGWILQVYETKASWNEFCYLIIYGRSKNGWFIAIPNWYVSTEASEPEDEFYNAKKLEKLNLQYGASDVVARAIREHWEGLKE